jgi:hypothetical protein
LDFENRGIAQSIVRVKDYVIERPTFGRPLEFDSINCSAGQTAGFGPSQH